MDELLQQLKDKTGLEEDKIKQVVSGVMDFLGDKLPAPIASQVKKFLGGDDDAGDSGDAGGGLMDKAKGALGGLLGN